MDPLVPPSHYMYNNSANNAQSSYSHHDYPHYPPPPLQNPNPLYPPGVDSSYHYPTATTYDPQPASALAANYYYHQDPTAISTWDAKDSIRHYGAPPPSAALPAYSTTAISSLNNISTYPMDSNNGFSHPVANDAIQNIPKKTKVLQSMRCGVCNVDCNSQIAFNSHLAGKKHAAQAGMMRPNTMVRANPIHNFSTHSIAQPPFKKAKGKALKKPTIMQSAWCEICSIDCTSQDVLNKHRMGKKHQKKLEKLSETKNVASTPISSSSQMTKTPIGPQEKLLSNNGEAARTRRAKKKAASALEEDVETKRKKVVSEGAAADAVRVCATCNVVCNSQTVFNFHLAGHKHAAMVKKLEEARGTTTNAAQILSVA